eukprot:6284887-Lingulodinium_polyedra.AAC.1
MALLRNSDPLSVWKCTTNCSPVRASVRQSWHSKPVLSPLRTLLRDLGRRAGSLRLGPPYTQPRGRT